MKNKILTLLAFSLFSTTAFAEGNVRPYLPHDNAMKGILACVEMAQKNGWSMSIVVVDRGEDVVSSLRMDGALPGSYTGASLKAITALSWGTTTGKVNKIMDKYPVFKQFPGIMGIDGGAPVFSDKVVIAGVGVAGNAMNNDAECAKAAVAAMQ